jgi:hypothetical protein
MMVVLRKRKHRIRNRKVYFVVLKLFGRIKTYIVGQLIRSINSRDPGAEGVTLFLSLMWHMQLLTVGITSLPANIGQVT